MVVNRVTVIPLDFFMDLDRTGPIPVYFQLAQKIEELIVKGDLPAGSRLENEVSLGIRLSLSRPTVRRALQDLVDKGLLVRRRGIGTQVVYGKVKRSLELTSLFEDLALGGQKPTTKILGLEIAKADAKVAEFLAMKVGEPVLHIRRLRFSKGVPLAILENWLPKEFIDMTEESLTHHGLYQLLRSRGASIRVAKQSIGARKATAPESNLLEIQKNSPLLTMNRTAYDNSGHAVEVGNHCYRPDLYSFDFTLVEK